MAIPCGECLRGFAALLGLTRKDGDDLGVCEHPSALTGDFLIGDRGEHHPDSRGMQLISAADGFGQVALEGLFDTHRAHHGTMAP